jgi:uncharacterized protein
MMTGAEPPERTCVGCGKKRGKESLHRLVLNEQNQPVIDEPQRAPGRGAYLCGPGCLKAAAKRKALQRAFRGKVKALELTSLEAALQGTP